MTADGTIVAENLTKRFARNIAISDVSFEIEANTIVGFLGPNGAGKSTAMRILACFMPATSGRATVAGFDVAEQSLDVRRSVGYMPENVPLYGEMRVEEYLDYRARLKGVRRRERRAQIEECLERAWVTNVRRQLIGTLSKGYRQRVGLAESMIGSPRILILDEPTVGLDPHQIRQARSVIRELGRDRTVLLSTHILSEVEMICDRVIMINGGKIVFSESLKSLVGASRSNRLVVAGRGPKDEMLSALGSLPGVASARADDADASETPAAGEVAFTLDIKAGADSREAVFRLFTERNWTLLEIHAQATSLEDIFVERLTQRGTEAKQ